MAAELRPRVMLLRLASNSASRTTGPCGRLLQRLVRRARARCSSVHHIAIRATSNRSVQRQRARTPDKPRTHRPGLRTTTRVSTGAALHPQGQEAAALREPAGTCSRPVPPGSRNPTRNPHEKREDAQVDFRYPGTSSEGRVGDPRTTARPDLPRASIRPPFTERRPRRLTARSTQRCSSRRGRAQ
jgi:hypothetical protein